MSVDIDVTGHHLVGMTTPEPDRPGNHGAELLALAIKAKSIGINKAGKLVGAPSGYVSRLLSGERKPNRKLAVSLQETFGVPPAAWDQELPEETDGPVDPVAKTDPPPSGDVPPADDLESRVG